jgi:uncharacterized protein
MLWQFRRKTSDQIHYLFGTMHIGSAALLLKAGNVVPYLESCPAYAAEMRIDIFYGNEIIRHLRLPEHLYLTDLFIPKHYSKYMNLLERHYGLDPDYLRGFTPFFIVNLITQKILSEEGYESIDSFLWNYAQNAGKTLLGVERPEEQISYLYRIPLAEQVKGMKKCLGNISKFNKQIHSLQNLYLKEDLSALYHKTKHSLGSLRTMMLYERNVKMRDSIITISAEQATFFALGAAHLPGEKGLLRYLKLAGYEVKKVNLPK